MKTEPGSSFTMGIFLKLEGMPARSEVPDYIDWLRVDSLQFGVGRGISSAHEGQPRELSEVSVSEITLSRKGDDQSPVLFRTALAKKPTHAVITVVNLEGDKPELMLQYVLNNVLVSGFSTTVQDTGIRESLSLNFTSIEYGSPKGPRTNYDLATLKVS